MRNFTGNTHPSKWILAFVFALLLLPFRSLAQCPCTTTGTFPTTINGITISVSNTGSVGSFGNYSSCGLTAGPALVGQFGPFTQTYTFSQPVNNVSYVITAASGGESFSFSAGSGVGSTSQCGSGCPFSQVGNTFTCQGGNDGTIVTLSSTTPFTSFTVSGPGGSAGSLVGLCAQSIILCPTPTISIIPSAAICQGATRTLTVTGATNYTWSPAASLSTTSGSVVVASPSVTTTYTLLATGSGTCTASAITTVSVTPSPTVAVSPSLASICLGSSTALTASGATSYSWSPAAALSNTNTANVSASPTATTIYTVTGANGTCTSSATATINVIAAPVLTLTPSFTTICAGSSAAMTATGATNYTWTPATGLNNANLATVVASPATTTTYTVTGDNGICTGTAVATVSVMPVMGLTINPIVSTICPNTSTTLTASGANSYTWSPSASLSSSMGAVVIATPAATTNYTLTRMIGICTNSAVVTVNVITNPTITVSPQNSSVCAGSSVTLTASGSAPYAWSPATGLSATSGSVVVATPPVGTTVYTVTGGVSTCTAVTQVSITVDAMPSLTVTPITSSICAGTTGTLSAAGASSYSWSPTASITTGSLVTLGPLATTVYTVTGAIGSCTTSATTTLNVTANPVLTIAPLSTLCAGTTTNLTVSGASAYSWSPSTGLSTTTGSVVLASPAATQVYTITGTLNTCTAVASATVTVIPRPVVVMGPDAAICSGSSATISASGATTYSWLPSIGLASTTGGTVTGSPGSTTSYTVTGTTSGCSSTGSVTINVTPTPTLSVTASPPSMCVGLSSVLTAAGAPNYTWSPGGALSAVNLPATTANPVQTTTYTVIGANGLCTASATVELVVVQTVTVQASKFGDVCLGQSTTIEAIGGTTYNWIPVIGISNANASSTSVRPSATTIYTVTASAPGLCASTSTVEVKVNPLPHVYAGRDTTINIDETITLTGTGDVEVGFLSPTATPLICNFCNAITVNPQETTCYVLKGENGYGCLDYDTVCVYVTKDFEVFIPNAFTPNADGYNDVFIPVGYGIATIRLTVFDRWGEQIFTSNETSIGWDGSRKGRQCEQGVYVYKAEVKTMAGHTVQYVGHVTLLPKSVTR